MAVVVEVAGISAHGAPATVQTDVAVAQRERAVAVIVINALRLAVRRTFAMTHGVNHILVIRPGELHDIEPAIVVVIAPERRASDAVLGDSGFLAHVGESAVAVVAIELRPAHGVRQEQVRVAVVVVVFPGGAPGSNNITNYRLLGRI